jgi:hypothetical protein
MIVYNPETCKSLKKRVNVAQDLEKLRTPATRNLGKVTGGVFGGGGYLPFLVLGDVTWEYVRCICLLYVSTLIVPDF